MQPTILSRRFVPAASVQSVVLPHAFGLRSIVAGWTWCATSTASAAAASTATTTMHSPTHRRLRQALRRQRCTARPLFTRPAWPRRALRSHDYQSAPRKLSVPLTIQALRARGKRAVILPHAFGLPAIVAGWTWCATSTASAAAASTLSYARWPRRTLHLHDFQRASRKPSANAVALGLPCAHHVSHRTAQAHTRGDRGVRYARTIVNAHHVS